MFRIAAICLFLLLAGALVAGAQQDYVDELIRLAELSDNQQYREAISGYKKLESGAPGWVKAGSEYEIAELYAELNETDNGTRSDSTYSGAGYIGLWADCGSANSGKFDDLKGGTL